MRTVVVIATGGTIASTSDDSGAKVAGVSGKTLLTGITTPPEVSVRVVEALSRNSYDIDFADMDVIRSAVTEALADGDTCGVVVTHGTDTLEESAMLVDLAHDDPRTVVFTGAQLSHDDPASDGPRNLSDAVTVASSNEARGLGALICFDGVLHAARGTRKAHTSDPSAFADVDNGAVGEIVEGRVRITSASERPAAQVPSDVALAGTRVDIVATYPGVDDSAIEAHRSRGADGIVLQASGYGNANADIVAAVERCVRSGVPVVLSTRVAAGEIKAVYGGGGGGVDLVAAGAIPSGHLRPSQARILLAALIASGRDREQICAAFSAEPQRNPADGV